MIWALCGKCRKQADLMSQTGRDSSTHTVDLRDYLLPHAGRNKKQAEMRRTLKTWDARTNADKTRRGKA